MLAIPQLKLPQCLLGSEAQLLAFAAALPRVIAARTVFAPLPEMFGNARSLAAAWSGCGMAVPPSGLVVHLRFGSVRTARVFKGAANAAVVAESAREQPLATSGHPFASGLHLPAAMQRVLTYGATAILPSRVDGTPLPAFELPPSCRTADLKPARLKPASRQAAAGGLDIVSFAAFSSTAWAAGAVPGTLPPSSVPLVLLPWNLDHPGSIVPELLARIARLQTPDAPRARFLVMPFNYLGQTGIIRRLIQQVADAADDRAALAHHALCRVTSLSGLPALRALCRFAWVEAGDPEHDWTMSRLAAAGFAPLALAAGEERCWIESETRYGTLAFHAALPSLREIDRFLGKDVLF
jgi:hypothetical protein